MLVQKQSCLQHYCWVLDKQDAGMTIRTGRTSNDVVIGTDSGRYWGPQTCKPLWQKAITRNTLIKLEKAGRKCVGRIHKIITYVKLQVRWELTGMSALESRLTLFSNGAEEFRTASSLTNKKIQFLFPYYSFEADKIMAFLGFSPCLLYTSRCV